MRRFLTLLQTNWDWRAAGNFMFGGTGSGLLLMMIAATFPHTPSFWLSVPALGFVGAGLFLVWLEIGRPKRAINVFFHPETSWMTREAFVATLVFATAFFGVIASSTFLVAIAGIGALGFLYCQARILMESKGIPAWREPAIVPLILSTGLAEGAAILLILLALSDLNANWIAFVMLALLALRTTAWLTYRQQLSGEKTPQATKDALESVHSLFMVVGNLVPAALMVIALLLPGLATLCGFIAGIAVAVAGWKMKFTIVTKAAQVQGYAFGKLHRGHPLGLKSSSAR
jgi:phenylacetyl-CoA:acceptor oxidoreductase subunit 2